MPNIRSVMDSAIKVKCMWTYLRSLVYEETEVVESLTQHLWLVGIFEP